MVNPKTPSAYKRGLPGRRARRGAGSVHGARASTRSPTPRRCRAGRCRSCPGTCSRRYVKDGQAQGVAAEPVGRRSGTGPYRFKEWKPGEKVVLVANPDYFEGRPYLSRIVYRVIPSQATIFLELKAKGIDVPVAHRAAVHAPDRLPGLPQGLQQVPVPGQRLHVLRLQPQGSALRRSAGAPGLRPCHQQARADRGRRCSGSAREAHRALQARAPGPTTPTCGRTRTIPAKARALLADAGWTERNADGILVKDGKPFDLRAADQPGQRRAQEGRRDHPGVAAEIGVEVDIRIIEWASLLKEYIKKRRFEAIVLGWGIGQRSRPVRGLALVEDRSRRSEPHLLREPRGGRAAGEGAHLLRRRPSGRSTTDRLHEILAEDAADHLPVLPRRAAGGLVAGARHRPGPGRHPLQLHRVVRAQAAAALHGGIESGTRLTLE